MIINQGKKRLEKICKETDSHYLIQYLKKNEIDLFQKIISTKSDYPVKNKMEQVYIYLYGRKLCLKCGQPTKFHHFKEGFLKFCSRKCSSSYTAKKRSISIKKTIKTHSKEFIINKMKKMSQTKLEKYGDKNYNGKNITREKILQYSIKKLLNSNRLKNLIIPLFNVEEYCGQKTLKGKALFYKFQCVKCKNIFEDGLYNGRIPRCFKCYPIERFTQPHKSICEYLEKENIDFEIEKYISPYFVDIFIKPDKIIEVYGDYWHGNPKFYKEGEFLNLPNEKILVEKKWEYDEKRINYLKENRFKILILWQNEINDDFNLVEEKIKKFL